MNDEERYAAGMSVRREATPPRYRTLQIEKAFV